MDLYHRAQFSWDSFVAGAIGGLLGFAITGFIVFNMMGHLLANSPRSFWAPFIYQNVAALTVLCWGPLLVPRSWRGRPYARAFFVGALVPWLIGLSFLIPTMS
jgi:hypothetical protein